MAYYGTISYCNSVGYAAVLPRSGGAAAGQIVRQSTTPAVNYERCFVCIVSGGGGGLDPTWVLTRGAKTVDGSATWQECTGCPAVNGDLVSTPDWTVVKGKAVSIGQIIKRNSAASYQICSTAGTANNVAEPAFSDAAGATVTDGTVVWTSLGLVENFVKGGAPHARIRNAGADPWFITDGTIFVGDNHAESQATDPGFGTSYPAQNSLHIGKMICHNHAGNYPPTDADLTTGAMVSTTNADISFSPGGSFYVYGVTFKAYAPRNGVRIIISPQGGGNKQNWSYFDRCLFWLAAPFSSSYIFPGGFVCVFNNTSLRLAAGGGRAVIAKSRFTWRNSTILTPDSQFPQALLQMGNAVQNHMDVLFEACDLSSFPNKLNSNEFWWQGTIVVKDCKLHPNMTIDTDIGYVGTTVEFMGSGSGARSERYVYEGSDITETGITRVGGAVDPTGLAQSRKLVTNTAALWVRPLQGRPLAVWLTPANEPVTLTVYGLASALSLNDEIWVEVEYLADPASTIGTIVTTTKTTVLSLGVAVEADSSSWNNAPAGWVPFKLSMTVTPAHASYAHVRPMVGRANTTFYIDPQVVLE